MILAVIIIFSYCLYRLIKKRQTLIRQFVDAPVEEGFSLFGFGNEMNNELSQTQDFSNSPGLSNVKNADLTLKEYVVKSSYNSASTGSYVNLNMIKYVLSRGCRFLDFEVFAFNDKPYVAFSADNVYSNIDSKNKILLSDVLSTIVGNAFVNPSPNTGDPIFIHLRIKSLNTNLYKSISSVVSSTIGPKLHTCDINLETKLSDILGKIILIIDKKTAPDYKKYSTCSPDDSNCNDLSKQINLESGGDYLRSYKYSEMLNLSITPPYIFNDNTTDIKTMRLVMPDIGTNVNNPSVYEFVVDYGAQFVAYPFYVKDDNLINYEKVFSDNKSAFIPMSTIVPYLNRLNEEGDI